MLGTDLVLFLALRARLASLSVAVLTYCLLVGMVASLVEVFSGMLLGRLRRPGVPPRWLALSFPACRSPRLLLLELFASFKFRVAALAGLLFSSSCTCLVSSGTAASRMFECGLALSGLGGCSPLGVLPPRFPLGCLLPFWAASAAAWGLASHFFFPYLFLWSRCRSMVLGRDSAEVLPSGWFPLAVFLEGVLPPLWRWQVWMVESSRPIRSSGRFPWCLFASILFPSCATLGRFDVPGVLVSGSGLSASACSHACGRFRGIALGPGAGFPFVSLPGGRVV